jgi:sulfonate transport system permease protein
MTLDLPAPTAAQIIAPREAMSGLRDLSRTGEVRRLRSRRETRHLRKLLRIALPVVLLAAWEITSATGFLSPRTLDSPTTVVSAFNHLIATGQLQAALGSSLERSAIGLAIGFTTGTLLGLVTGLSRLGEELLDSSMQMFRMVPFLAVIPLLITWFGIGELAKDILIAFACVFPAYINTYAAVRSIDPKLLEAARTFGLKGRRLVRTVILPNSMPGVLIGLRFSMGVSILALIAAEQINANSGLGYLVAVAEEAFRNDIIVALILIYAVLGLLIDLFVRVLERVLLPWRGSVVSR